MYIYIIYQYITIRGTRGPGDHLRSVICMYVRAQVSKDLEQDKRPTKRQEKIPKIKANKKQKKNKNKNKIKICSSSFQE